ncbi:MAG TPA: Na+/H+ antiporter subunit E [Jiangellaceae bacterium]|nr:Na+/H+ antiporter subunit E [Jiangellaceae bacterium]
MIASRQEGAARWRHRRRGRLQWPMLLALMVLWVMLWGQLTVANLLGGLAVAIVVKVVFPLPPIIFEGKLRPLSIIRLIGFFVSGMLQASIEVSIEILRPREPRNALIEVPLRGDSDLVLTLTAEIVCLIPGSVVVEVHRTTHTLYVHSLNVRDDEAVEHARAHVYDIERRVVDAMGSQAHREAVRAASSPKGGRK